jgi:crossover junction endodeoxyribonuclease RuvC
MRVLGVDPGNAVTGYGIVEGMQGAFRLVAAGTIRTDRLSRGPLGLKKIHEELLAIVKAHAPVTMSLERSFVAANVQSAFRLGEARAVAMLVAAECGLSFFEYAPNEVKLAVAAYGHADKAQVQFMVRKTLGLADDVALAYDAADALALALCHLGRERLGRLERIAASLRAPRRSRS